MVCALSAAALGHPGSGIDVGPDGSIVFADVGRTTIWRLDPDGDLTPLVRDTWTHELTFTPEGDVLYFEREGDADGPAPTGLRRVRGDGEVETVFPLSHDRSDFTGEAFNVLPGVGIVFSDDVRGADGRWRQTLRVRPLDGASRWFSGSLVSDLYTDGAPVDASFRLCTDIVATPEGELLVLDRDRVRRVRADGSVETVVDGLLDARPRNPPHSGGPPTTNNRLYALDLAPDGAIFVSYHAGRRVMRALEGGRPETIFTSDRGWAPIGVACGSDAYYVLEVRDDSLDLRVWRVGAGGERDVVCEVGGGR